MSSNETERMGQNGYGEDWGGVGGRETVIKIYYVREKAICNKRKKRDCFIKYLADTFCELYIMYMV